VRSMNKHVIKSLNPRKLWFVIAVTSVMLLTPLLGVFGNAEARGRRHGGNYGSIRREANNNWYNGNNGRRGGYKRISPPRRQRWNNNSRYRLRYRTVYDRNGRPYRQWFRSYY